MAALIVAGCNRGGGGSYTPKPAKPVPTVKNSDLDSNSAMPLEVGNTWVYSIEWQGMSTSGSGSNAEDVTWKVVKVEPVEGGKQATIEMSGRDGIRDRQLWRVTSKGVYQLSAGLKNPVTFNPPQPMVLFPADPKRTFEWKGQMMLPNNKMGPATIKSTILEPIVVDTGSKPMTAIPVNSKFDYGKEGVGESDAYIAPNVGLVRYVIRIATPKMRVVQVLLLKSFKSGK